MHAEIRIRLAHRRALQPGLRPLLLAALVVSGAGCGGSNTSSPPPAPPTAVVVSGVPGEPEQADLAWTGSTDEVDGYLVELKIGGGAFQAQNDLASLIPPEWSGLRVTLAPGTPDLVDYVVRMQSVRRGVRSAWSAEAAWHRPLRSPSGLTARFDWTSMGVALQWSRVSTAATGFTVQRVPLDALSLPTGPWVDLPVTEPAAVTYLDTTVSLNGRYAYRVANRAGATTSPPVAVGPVLAGLAAPAAFTLHFDFATQASTLDWTTVAADATGTRVERQPLDGSFTPTGPWEKVVEVPSTQSDYLDQTWPELTWVAYRVTNLHGAYQSEPDRFDVAVQTPLRQPTGLTAAAAGRDIDLAWVNQSQLATGVELRWGPQVGETGITSTLASLPPTAVSHRASGLGLGSYRFRAVARHPQGIGLSAELDFTTPNPAGALALQRGSLPANGATAAVLRPGGGWAFLATASGTSSLSILSPGDPWQALDLSDKLLGSTPAFAADASGWPHVVYGASLPGGATGLLHRWFDGAAWQQETIYQGPILGRYGALAYAAALDPAGSPQALVVTETTPGSGGLLWFRREGGSWASETVPVPAISSGLSGTLNFGVDDAGAPHVALASEWTRSAQGTWTSSPLPVLNPGGETHAIAAVTWIDAQNAVVLAVGRSRDTLEVEVVVAEKVAGVWQPLRLLASDREMFPYFEPAFALARSAGGARVAVLHDAEVGMRAYSRDAGVWTDTLIGPARSATARWIGFDDAGRFQGLLKLGGAAGEGYQTLQEP